ncbi:hypothetical protein ABT093_08515 [Kitasatospora sp. NPDC002551]|uniref:hypothetical protein n=1 Tax=Kitasatospora sp. NPDC002551 TaxID=3154539 RepID=UPI00331B27C8
MSVEQWLPGSEISTDSPLLLLERKLKADNVTYERSALSFGSACALRIKIKNGRECRTVLIDENDASDCMGLNLSEVRALGNYSAFDYPDNGPCIEVQLAGSVSFQFRTLQRIPGFQIQENEQRRLSRDEGWTVPICGGPESGWSAEIGPSSEILQLLSQRHGTASLKLRNISGRTHDESLLTLEKVANAIIFDLDVKYGISLELLRVRSHIPRARRPPFDSIITPPGSPRLEYGKEPLSLYQYARSALGMPLLEFLAYYQVLEYYYPRYSQRDTLDRLRNELRHPRFNVNSDGDLARVLQISRQSGRGFGDERSQLTSTLRYCVSEESLKEFILDLSESQIEHFTGKQEIKGIKPLSLKGDLIGQVSERAYDVRCRVVHSKEGGGASSENGLLLPFSKEADAVRIESLMMRFLAQKVLVASASPMAI